MDANVGPCFNSSSAGVSTAPSISHALVVFGSDIESDGLAANFAKISKKFSLDGYNLTCLSGLNLRCCLRI